MLLRYRTWMRKAMVFAVSFDIGCAVYVGRPTAYLFALCALMFVLGYVGLWLDDSQRRRVEQRRALRALRPD